MKIVVRVELIADRGEVNTIEVGRIDRPSQNARCVDGGGKATAS